MAGPIEFASDVPVDDKGPTEYGGRAGLVQGDPHELTGPEKRGILVRGQGVSVIDSKTGLSEVDETVDAVDPVTGLVVDPVWNEDGAAAKSPVDPLRTGSPTAAEI